MMRLHRRALLSASLLLAFTETGLVAGLSPSLRSTVPRVSAQPAEKVHHVGVLFPGEGPGFRAFRQALRDLGYSEGRNLTITTRWFAGNLDPVPLLAEELVRQKVDVIVAFPDPAALAAKAATSTTPIVFIAGYPVPAGLVSNLARPGSNLTGFAVTEPGFTEKQMALLKEMVPRATRLAALLEPAAYPLPYFLPEVMAAGDKLGLQVQVLRASTAEEIDRAFEAAGKAGADAMHVYATGLFARNHARIAALAKNRRLPVISFWPEFVTAGGLMSYGTNLRDLFVRMAAYVDRILKGARPGDLPVEQPIKYDFAINVKTARELGLTVPPSLLLQADKVIQ
jgi:putative tryptophan/tyrosine transport system substrate-binding protein